MIEPQVNDPFPPKLAEIIEQIYKDIDRGNIIDEDDIYRLGYDKLIADLIYKRFGLKVYIYAADTNYYYYTYPFFYLYNYLSFRYQPWWKDDETPAGLKPNIYIIDHNSDIIIKQIRDILEKSTTMEIDLKRAKIKGFNMRNILGLNILSSYLDYGVTSRELAGMILHEIGHMFTFLEYATILNNSLKSLDHMYNKYRKDKNIDKFIISFKEVLTQEQFRKAYEKDVLNNKQNTRIGYFNKMAIYSYLDRVSLIHNHYQHVTVEQTADHFSGMFGMGGYITTGLKKFDVNNTFRFYKTDVKDVPFGEIFNAYTYIVLTSWFNKVFNLYILFVAFKNNKPISEDELDQFLSIIRQSQYYSLSMYDGTDRRMIKNIHYLLDRMKEAKNIPSRDKQILLDTVERQKQIEVIGIGPKDLSRKITKLYPLEYRLDSTKRILKTVEDIISNPIYFSSVKYDLYSEHLTKRGKK